MIIDDEAFKSSDFSLMGQEELVSLQDNKDLLTVLKKHEIVKSHNPLTDSEESQYITLINYINELYYLNKPIPTDIAQLLKTSSTYKSHLLTNVTKRLNNLTSNGSAIFFKEIVSVINLLSLGEKFNIFITYNDYDFTKISDLFRFYENQMQQLFMDDKEHFQTIFACYLSLIDAFNRLCVINSTDLKRKKTITPIVELITESINMVKFTIALDETSMKELNNILGRILYYFSHLPFIDAKGKELYYLIDEYYLLLEKQTDGFMLSKDTDFGGNIKRKEAAYSIFLNNSAFLLLTMLQKLKFSFKDKDYFNTRSFQKCLRLFSENFPNMHVVEGEETLQTFKNKLLNALTLKYQLTESSIIKEINHHSVVDDFIQSAENYEINNLKTMHALLLFADDVDDYKYLHIGETLISSKLIPNDYYEFYKLKTVDIVINYFINNKTKENIVPFIEDTLNYIEHNKAGSHLLSMFSKLYLSIAHYYSTLKDATYVDRAKDLYAIFINMNGLEILQNEYFYINRSILISLGEYYAKELDLNEAEFTPEQLVSLGKKLSKSYLEYKDLELKYSINESIANITAEILYEENIDYEDINNKIANIIANKIFYGLCVVRIKGLTKEQATIVDNGYKLYAIPIMREYILQFIFPAVYENAFKHILNENKNFIKKNVSNILASYSKNSLMYIDETTGLENLNKLKLDLDTTKDKNITFIEVLVGSLQKMNRKYGFEVGNKYLRSITQKIKSILEPNDYVYYMGGGRIGIILGYGNDFNTVTKKIFNFKIKKDGEDIDMRLTIAVVQDKTSVILSQSAELLDKALTSEKNILINIK